MGIAAMNASLKNNRQLLKNGKRKPFSKTNGGGSKKTSYKRYTLPLLPPHVLRRIRRRVKKQNRLLRIKKVVTLVIVFGIILFLVAARLL